MIVRNSSFVSTKDDGTIMNLLSIFCSSCALFPNHHLTVGAARFHSHLVSVNPEYNLSICYSANKQPLVIAECNQQEKVLPSLMAVPSNILR